jgi:hypothetical protein
MRRSPMILCLERQERVDRGDRGCILASNPDFASPGKRVRLVSNQGAPGGHHGSAGNRLGVNEAGKGEITPAKPDGDVLHVGADGGGSGGIHAVALQHDAAPVGQGLEYMRGGVLIDAHGDGATPLHRRERAVGPGPRIGSRGPRATQEQSAEDEMPCHHAKLSSD